MWGERDDLGDKKVLFNVVEPKEFAKRRRLTFTYHMRSNEVIELRARDSGDQEVRGASDVKVSYVCRLRR